MTLRSLLRAACCRAGWPETRSDPSWSGWRCTDWSWPTTIATSPRSKMLGSSPAESCIDTVATRRTITSATVLCCVARPDTRWCSTSYSVMMPASLPLSSTGICEMPCCLEAVDRVAQQLAHLRGDDRAPRHARAPGRRWCPSPSPPAGSRAAASTRRRRTWSCSCAPSRAGCTTTRWPGFICRHTCIAAHTAEPLEPPTSRPSWRMSWRATRNESRSLLLIHSWTRLRSSTSGMKS